jgi:hypothetical protein
VSSVKDVQPSSDAERNTFFRGILSVKLMNGLQTRDFFHDRLTAQRNVSDGTQLIVSE